MIGGHSQHHDTMTVRCNIVAVGKRRDGGTRYWCLAHRADATAKYGVQADKCRYAGLQPPAADQILEIDPGQYSGGIALWGAVPPVYDTTALPLEGGIHVHARKTSRVGKALDGTYRAVRVTKPGCSLSA